MRQKLCFERKNIAYRKQIIYKSCRLVYNVTMIILASKSPRRKELLGELNVKFDIIPAIGEEMVDKTLSKSEIARNIALHKAKEVFAAHPDCIVIGADTIVVLGDEILQKPKDDADERRMLEELSGETHYVYTGYAMLSPSFEESGADVTEVYFNRLSEKTIDDYVKSGLGLDKAGGYGIQDGFNLVEKINGSYSNVVGFPQEVFKELFKKHNIV